MSKVFKDFFSNFAESLLKLPNHSNKYNLQSTFLYYSNFAIPEVFHIKSTSEEKVFKRMENIEMVLKFYLSLLVKFAISRFLMEYS